MTADTMVNDGLGFDIEAFLEEYGSSFDDSFRGNVLPMMIQAGIGVFAGKESKFYPVRNHKMGSTTLKIAQKYADKIEKDGAVGYTPRVTGCVQQVWYADILGREADKQPAGKWEEMKRKTSYKEGDEWFETGDWLVFSKQWIGDDPPVKTEDFGKKLWVHQVWARHPEFNEELWMDEDGVPNFDRAETSAKYTIEMRDGEPVLDDNGKVRAKYFRVVAHVIGEDREKAEKWYEENAEGEGSDQEAPEVSIQDKFLELKEFAGEDLEDDVWVDCLGDVFNSIHDGTGSSGSDEFIEEWGAIGITNDVIEKLEELTKSYPPL